jgi:uncharacterized protein YyaL (SSP411 family)
MDRRLTPLVLALLVASVARADDPQKPANRLARETSPYLLQHAHNPVDWWPWGPEVFAKAKEEDRPIFLSVGYSSCYWCHVMERECFENEEIAKKLNAGFICIKVDREERPDVDTIYMAALRAYSGGGGWPMSIFLMPDGRPFFGGTYFPAVEKNGIPGFGRLLDAVRDAWKDHRAEIEKDAAGLTEATRKSLTAEAKRRAPLTRTMGTEGVAQLFEQYDPQYGGFGFDPDRPSRPKFPEPVNLVFLLDRLQRKAETPRGTDPRRMLEKTLDALARGGIRDHLAGGYHRYSVDRRWTVPHFEKMLYDQAQLVFTFVRAYEQTRDPRWEREARDTLGFVARSLTAPEGGFYSALDAEAEAEEGKTYVWTRAEVKKVLGDRDYEVFASAYGLDLDPNFEQGRYVLLTPKALDKNLDTRLAPMRAKLLAVRDQRPQPFRDDKVLTAWNGLMIGAYAEAFRVLRDETYRQAAEKAADFVWTKLRDENGRLLRTYRAGQAKLPSYLEDHAFIAQGLMRLHQATGDANRLEQCRALMDRVLTDFADEQDGGFYTTADDHETLLARPKDAFDNALPGGNSMAILVLVELARATKDDKYLDAAGKALDSFSTVLQRMPAGAPLMLVGLEAYLDEREKLPQKVSPLRSFQAQALEAAVDVLKVGVKAPEKVAAGESLEVTINLDVQDGWHIYANPSGSETTPPTRIEIKPGAPAKIAAVEYPRGNAKSLAANGGARMMVYEGKVAIPVRLKIDPKTPGGPIEVPLRVRYQACDDRRCLAPAVAEVAVKTRIGE